MADESLQLPTNQNLDYHIITLFQRLETMYKESNPHRIGGRLSTSLKSKYNMQVEIRTMEFWRSILAECLSSFLYVFIVCGAAAGTGVGASLSSVLLATALSSGFVVTTLTQCFSHISGAHINPAVTFAMAVIRAISPLRAAMYITAHCGGGIAGAALLNSYTVPDYKKNLEAAIDYTMKFPSWERFAIEMVLTFLVVLAYLMAMDSHKTYFGVSALSIGCAYSAGSFVSMPYLNPARSLGPAFVLNRWDNQWVYWLGPLCGGFFSGLIYKYFLNPRRAFKLSKDIETDSASISDDDTNFELDSDKPNQQSKFIQHMQQHQGAYSQNLYTMDIGSKPEQLEPIYGGTRSMYCKSPQLTRSNLNRSQSVYTKSNSALNREIVPRAGPLVPAQSLYPLRVSSQAQSSHLQNQNVQNQLQQRSESIYGIRSSMRPEQRSMPPQQQQQQQPQQPQQQQLQQLQQSENAGAHFQTIYGSRPNPNAGSETMKFERDGPQRDEQKLFVSRQCRPDSMYGVTQRRGQSAASDDSSYGSYQGTNPPNSSTPMSQTSRDQMINGNYHGQSQCQPQQSQMRQNSGLDRKPSMSGPGEQRAIYGQVPMQPKSMHNGNNSIPITHQYNMQQSLRS